MTDLVSSRTRINQPEIPDPPPPPANAGPPEMEPAREPLCTEEEADALVAEIQAIKRTSTAACTTFTTLSNGWIVRTNFKPGSGIAGRKIMDTAESGVAFAGHGAFKAYLLGQSIEKRKMSFGGGKAPKKAKTHRPLLVDEQWVGCEQCDRWRILPPGAPQPDDNEPWYCFMYPDPARASCEAAEEEDDLGKWEKEQEQLRQLGEAHQAKAADAKQQGGGRRHTATARREGLPLWPLMLRRKATPSRHELSVRSRSPRGLAVPCMHPTRRGGAAALKMTVHANSNIRRLGYHEDEAGAAFESAKYLAEYQPEFDELRASLLEEANGKTLVGKQLDFYWPLEDTWYTATVMSHHGNHADQKEGSSYTIEWNDDNSRQPMDLARPTFAWRAHKAGGEEAAVVPMGGKNLVTECEEMEAAEVEAMAAAEGLTLATEGAGGAGSSSDSNSGYKSVVELSYERAREEARAEEMEEERREKEQEKAERRKERQAKAAAEMERLRAVREDALWPAVASALKAFEESIGGNKPVETKALKSKAAKALREAQVAFDKQKQNVEAGVEMAAEEENWGTGV